MKRKYILELDDKYLRVYKACEALDIRFSELTELVCCKDCKHRPKKKYEDYHEGFNLVFPDDSRCPCQCEDDPWYNWMPDDDWHCGNAERKEE